MLKYKGDVNNCQKDRSERQLRRVTNVELSDRIQLQKATHGTPNCLKPVVETIVTANRNVRPGARIQFYSEFDSARR